MLDCNNLFNLAKVSVNAPLTNSIMQQICIGVIPLSVSTAELMPWLMPSKAWMVRSSCIKQSLEVLFIIAVPVRVIDPSAMMSNIGGGLNEVDIPGTAARPASRLLRSAHHNG